MWGVFIQFSIKGDVCYVANLGDSRAVLSADRGRKIIPLSEDHKPSEEFEKNRILAAGGKIYQYDLLPVNLDD